MRTYIYLLKSSAGEAAGTIEAADALAAEAALKEQYAGELVDEKGEKFSNEAEQITLTEIVT